MPPTETPAIPGQREFAFKLGADPEFLLFYGKRKAPANKTMEAFLAKTQLETNEKLKGYKIPNAGILGWDGHAATGEIRPDASKSPEKVAENIGTIFTKLNEVMPFMEITTLSIGEPIGGHIHLEIPTAKQTAFTDTKFKQTLSKIMASFIMPILASEHRLCSASRYTSTYGKAGDLRIGNIENHPGVMTCEVRGMSAEWTVSKKISTATLAYLGVVWHQILKEGKAINKNPILFRNQTQVSAIQEMLLSDYRPIINTVIDGIRDVVKTFEMYPMFKEEVDFLLNTAAVRKEKEENGWNINSGWNFRKDKNITKKDVLATKKISKVLKKINYENMRGDFSLAYNNDYNVGIFTDTIAERIAALGWVLENEYFFFGLKKGDEGYAVANVAEDKYYVMPKNRDRKKVKEALERMRERFMDYRGTAIRIDPKTGKTVGGKRECILVGIPYEDRVEKDTKKFISLIWDLEKQVIKPMKFEELSVIVEKNDPTPETSPETEALNEALEDAPTINPENIKQAIWNRDAEDIDLTNDNQQ